MGDPTTTTIFGGSLGNVLDFLGAAAGLGTAAMGVVDSSKAFFGGPSNFGFGHIEKVVKPLLAPPGTATAFGEAEILRTLRANWLNGVDKAEQKAKAKSLIHLGLTPANAVKLATATGVDAAKLESLARKVAAGEAPDQSEINVLGQFDAVASAILDAAYERGDQKYRNSSKVLAMGVAILLGAAGGWILTPELPAGSAPGSSPSLVVLGALVGLIATPLAPIAKDVATSLQSAVKALGARR